MNFQSSFRFAVLFSYRLGLVFILVGGFVLFGQKSGAQSMLSHQTSKGLARAYPGGADEEDLKVQAELKVPSLKTDRRSLQIEVLKTEFKKDVELPVPQAEGEPEAQE